MPGPAERDASFLRRWSQRKLAAAREAQAKDVALPAAAAAPVAPAEAASTEAPPAAPAEAAGPPLPDVASLTFDSDYAGFLSPKVEEATRRRALRKLFSDPRFNVQDGLDVYIDDYGKFEPVPESVLAQLAHARYLFDPPKTRVNAQGHVEDVVDAPDDPVPPEAASAAPAPAQADDPRAGADGAGTPPQAGPAVRETVVPDASVAAAPVPVANPHAPAAAAAGPTR